MESQKVKINEVFYSLQGEGIYAGIPMAFVRLQGCNFSPGCAYCDTPYAQKAQEGGVERSIDQIFWEIGKYSADWVCITGGEPLMQHKSLTILLKVLSASYFVEVETNGSISPYVFDEEILADNLWSVDVKCPSAKVTSYYAHEWMKVCEPGDQIKFVVSDKEDLEFVKSYLSNWRFYGETVHHNDLQFHEIDYEIRILVCRMSS